MIHRLLRTAEVAMRAALGVCVLLGLLGLVTMGLQRTAGFGASAVLSGSMSPEMPVGALVITRPVAASQVRPGDVITFHPPGAADTVTHRVIALEQAPAGAGGGTVFVTKGDANAAADPWRVHSGTQDVQRVVAHLPQLGFVTLSLERPLVRAAIFVVPVVLFGLLALIELWRDGTDEDGGDGRADTWHALPA